MSESTRDFTATTFVVDQNKTLLLFHKKIQMWLPPGGHIDPNELPCDAARREVKEETGLEAELIAARTQMGSVSVLSQPECILLEQITPDHQHIDLIYFAYVTGGVLTLAEDEATAFRWCTSEDLASSDYEDDIRQLARQAIAKVAAFVAPN